jgi:hypothetical protein
VYEELGIIPREFETHAKGSSEKNTCWYCVKACPTRTIHANWDKLVAMAPEQYARYRKTLDDAATRGEFRWLIDPDTLDFDTPLYKQREHELEN